MSQANQHEWNQVAKLAINLRHTIAYDVCSEHGQMFGNVVSTRWLRDAVADELRETFETPGGADLFIRTSAEDFPGDECDDTDERDALCPECGCQECTCQSDWANGVNTALGCDR